MIVLGIETSCDDTCAAIYDGRTLLSNVISTQLIHKKFGGVVPELASRSHVQFILPVIKKACYQANLKKEEIEGVAVTYGPGLAGSLLVGLSAAKGIALSLNLPFVGINHLEGHIWANRLIDPDLNPPFVVLIASGGHTQLVYVRAWYEYEVMGRTRDDAAGEAFDKVGKLLEVGYPGGPVIEKLAKHGNPNAIRFPRAFLEEKSLDFSFSGLKTAVLNYVRSTEEKVIKQSLNDISASFQEAVIDILVKKTMMAAQRTGVKQVCLSGGVACNRELQKQMLTKGEEIGITVRWPTTALSSDNGGMIAFVGHSYLQSGNFSSFSLSPNPSLNF